MQLPLPFTKEQHDMSSTVTTLSAAALPATPHVSAWKNILDHVKQFFNIAISDVIKYVPKAESLAETLLPEYATLEKTVAGSVVAGFTLLQNTVLTIEQKYSDDTKSKELNDKKLADAIAIAGDPFIALLKGAGVTVDATRTSNIINAIVAVLKVRSAPTA